ncbi:MAG: hypothetical protein MI923_04600 [Phycisphaerales bacterium]|nr:hypothetical protein [Phycisphaerales bacterium]
MGFLSVLSALLAVGFATESAGLYAHESNVALAVVFLLVGAVFDPATRRGQASIERRGLVFGILMAVVGMVLLPTPAPIRLFAIGLWFWGLDAVARACGQERAASAALAIGCLFGGVYQYGAGNSLLAWYAVMNVSPGTFGPTFNGITVFVFTLGACVGGALIARKRSLPRFILSLVGTGVLYLSYVFVFISIQGLQRESTALADLFPLTSKFLDKVNPLHIPLLLPLLLSIPTGWYLHRIERRANQPQGFGSPVFLFATSLAIAVAAWSLTNIPGTRRPGQLKVVFYEKGLLNWMVPNHQRYGSRSAGMFGNLPLMMERMGWKSEIVPEIDAESLSGTDILVIMNQNEPLPADALREVERLVESGGSLLVLGDHTFAKNPQASPFNPSSAEGEAKLFLNQPIENTNIRFRFDSAYYFLGGWLHSMQYWPHQTTARLGDATNESGCVVGASLEIEYPVAPLVIGRYGFADRGDWNAPKRGYMDDGKYTPGEEMLGDLVLVAAQNVGRGRVVVVGDTSGYVNMIQAQTWPFTSHIFHWLGSTGRATVPAWRDGLGLLLLFAVLLFVMAKSSSRLGYLPVACLMFIVAGDVSQTVLASVHRPEPLRGRVAVVDLSHVGLHSIEGWRDNGIAGVYLNLMRKGYFAIGSPTFDEPQISESDLFISIAPTQAYTKSELDFLENYMKGGGTVLLAAGWEEQAGSKTLLAHFGLTIPARPMGRGSINVPGTDLTPQFWKAWPVEGGETIVKLRGEDPAIVRKTVGRGQLVVIGDAGFLLNQNLENEEGGIIPNIRFLDWLLSEIEKKEGS